MKVIHCGLEGCFYIAASQCRLFMPIVSGVNPELNVDARHIFPQDVLAMITLIGGVHIGAGG